MSPVPRYAVGELAPALGLPFPDPPPEEGLVLERDPSGRLGIRLLGANAPGALTVDFRSPEFARRLAEGKKGLLGRAVGLAKGGRPVVWDATAGLGRDAVRLAALGAIVIAFERDPVVHALFADGLARAREGEDELATAIRERCTLRMEDAVAALASISILAEPAPDVVFLDPMFPARGSALARKEAQILQALLGEGGDVEADAVLFAAARSAGPRRIVVKRPKNARPIVEELEPNHRFEGKSVRFDLYL